MRICQLEIENFRGIKKGKVVFPDHAVLFGPNNVGKSSIIEALALLFERERLTRQVSDWDFHGGSPKPESRFFIIGTITDFAAPPYDEPENFPKWFLGDAARPVWWQPEARVVSVALDRPAAAKLACQIALCVRYEEESCEFEPIRYFYHGPCDPFTDSVTKLPAALLQELGVFLLPGNRQWDKLLSFGSSSFLKVLKSAGAIPGTAVEILIITTKRPSASSFSIHGSLKSTIIVRPGRISPPNVAVSSTYGSARLSLSSASLRV